MIPTPYIPGYVPIKKIEIAPSQIIVVEKFKPFIYVCYWYDDPLIKNINEMYDMCETFNKHFKDCKRHDTDTMSHFPYLYSLN